MSRPANNAYSIWAARALSQANAIVTPGRGPATEAEARAARYVQAQLSGLGVHDVRIQPFHGLRSIWLFLSLGYGLALLGHAAFWLLRSPFGELPALIVSVSAFASSAYLLWQKYHYRHFPLHASLPHGPSQNVIAVIPPQKEIRHRVVLLSHLDSHRAVILFASDSLVKLYTLLEPAAIYGVVLAPVAYGLSMIPGISFLAGVGVLLAGAHFACWFIGMTADRGPFSPGANDDAAGVGTILSLAERLKREPLNYIETWLVFAGCEQSGSEGMFAFLEEYGDDLQDALFLDFVMVGIGSKMAYLRRDGLFPPRRISRRVEQLLSRVRERFDLQPFDHFSASSFSEMGIVWQSGLQGACFVAVNEGSSILPEWRRLTDTVDKLKPTTLERAHCLGWSLLQELEGSSSW